MTDQSCTRHRWELSQADCSACHDSFCGQCLVYALGPDRPPMCVQCALVRAGVRSGGRGGAKSWRERRRLARLEQKVAASVRPPVTAGADASSIEVEPAQTGAWASLDWNVSHTG